MKMKCRKRERQVSHKNNRASASTAVKRLSTQKVSERVSREVSREQNVKERRPETQEHFEGRAASTNPFIIIIMLKAAFLHIL